MNASIVLAQILGISFTVLGLSMLCNGKFTAVAVEELVRNKGVMWIGGAFALVMGAIILPFNNSWNDWSVIITIVGWLALIKGAFILLLPNATASFYRKMAKINVFFASGFVALILGVVLLYFGFM